MQRVDQAAWRRARAGYVTASRFGDVMAFGKNGQPLKSRNDYLGQVVTERLSGEYCNSLLAPSLGWGNDVEPYAKLAYEIATGEILTPTEYIQHPTLEWVGGTPDALIGTDGGYESKCPVNSLVHLLTWLDGMPKEHVPQIQGYIWITGRKWWDFVSYDPRMPAHLRLYRQRIERDEDYIKNLEQHVVRFLKEVDGMLGRLAFLGLTEIRRAA